MFSHLIDLAIIKHESRKRFSAIAVPTYIVKIIFSCIRFYRSGRIRAVKSTVFNSETGIPCNLLQSHTVRSSLLLSLDRLLLAAQSAAPLIRLTRPENPGYLYARCQWSNAKKLLSLSFSLSLSLSEISKEKPEILDARPIV